LARATSVRIVAWLVEKLSEGSPTLVGTGHGLQYFSAQQAASISGPSMAGECRPIARWPLKSILRCGAVVFLSRAELPTSKMHYLPRT
jgi:hypothetical protein